MIQQHLLFLFLFFCPSLFAETSVRLTENAPEVALSSPSSFNLITDAASDGYGGTEDDAAIIYLPMEVDADAGEDNDGVALKSWQYHYNVSAANLLPSWDTASTEQRGSIKLSLAIELDGATDQYLKFAVNDGNDDYKVIEGNAGEGGRQEIKVDNSSLEVNILLSNICEKANTTCDEFKKTVALPSDREDILLYVFLGDNTAIDIDPDSESTGFFLKISLSSNIYDSSNPRLNDLIKGDSELTALFSGFSMGSYIEGIYGYILPNSADSCGAEDGIIENVLDSYSVQKGNLTNLNATTSDDRIEIKELDNSTCYNIRLTQCDKFGFCSKFTENRVETPESIEALLKKQFCFFFTAGFDGQHYVVDFLRRFRDRVLVQSTLGRKFINWYYATAPSYTHHIIENPFLKKTVRVVGYSLYWMLNYWWISLSVLGLVFIQILRKTFLRI